MANYVYGIHAVTALLKQQPECIDYLVLLSERQDTALMACEALGKKNNLKIERSTRAEMDALLKERVAHQGMVAVCKGWPEYSEESDLEGILTHAEQPRLILILDGIQDPHNLGACLRVANAMGVCCVIAPKDKSARMSGTVAKVSCGAVFTTPFIPVTNLARVMSMLKEAGIWLLGASADAKRELRAVDLKGDIAVVMGAEGTGLRRLTEEKCDFLAKISMAGSVGSLNVSVATGICLYEVHRQRI